MWKKQLVETQNIVSIESKNSVLLISAQKKEDLRIATFANCMGQAVLIKHFFLLKNNLRVKKYIQVLAFQFKSQN